MIRAFGTRRSSINSKRSATAGYAAFLALTGVLFLEVVGCVRGNERERATPQPAEAALPPAAAHAVDMSAQVGVWPGDPSIREHVTPVRLRLENDGTEPVRIEYKQLQLVEQNGLRLEALPLHRIAGSVPEQVILGESVDRPLWVYDKYWPAPAYKDIYPGISVYEVPYPADAEYYDRYQTYWVERPLPTTEMRRYLMPEGVLDVGGTVEGFIYFKPSRTPESVYVLVARFLATNGQQILAEARAPLAPGPSS